METAYHPGFGQAVNYSFDRLPDDPDGQVRETIAKVARYILIDAASPIIGEEARRAIEVGAGDPVQGLWLVVKNSMRFRQDADIASELDIDPKRKRDIIEVLIRPIDQALLMRLRERGFGDCDCYVMYAACVLVSLGIECALVTVAADPEEPRRFSHIYIAAYINGRRVPLDFSHGYYPGWECPNLGRIKEWPIRTNTGMVAAVVSLAALGFAYWILRVAVHDGRSLSDLLFGDQQ